VIVVLTRSPADTAAPGRVAADVARLAWAALGNADTAPALGHRPDRGLELHERYRVP
jgi:hypothetical protein